MAKNKLFDSWTWRRRAPSPFDTVDARRTDVRSHYSPATASASLHTPALCAILAYMQLDHKEELSDPDSAKGALGTQADNFVISEYPSHTGLTHVAIFNDTTGKFTAGKFAEGCLSHQCCAVLYRAGGTPDGPSALPWRSGNSRPQTKISAGRTVNRTDHTGVPAG